MKSDSTTTRSADATSMGNARDRGAVLPLVLVMVVIGSLIVLPVMSYATTVLKANSVLSSKTQRYEAVKAGMRTALYDPLDMFRECDQSQAAPVHYSTMSINDVDVQTTCQLVGYGGQVIDDHLRFGLVATEAGQSVPLELRGRKFGWDNLDAEKWDAIPTIPDVPDAPAETKWRSLTTSALQDNPNESREGTVWLPDLPSYPLVDRTRIQGWDIPSKPGGCTVYFPGKYADPLVLTGNVFFTSGIYYFEDEVRVEGGANVTVGDGRDEGCATSQEAVFDSNPQLGPNEPHSITGFGSTWLFGGEGRLVVSNANGQPVSLVFNRRYVDDRASDPSLFVSIASVNGRINDDGLTHGDLSIPGVISVPLSQVLAGPDMRQTPLQNEMVPSALRPTQSPSAAPVSLTHTVFRTSSSTGNTTNGGVYLTWSPPSDDQQGGVPIEGYEVFVRGNATPSCTVDLLQGDRLECLITGLSGSNSGVPHTVDVVAHNAIGASVPASVTFTVRHNTGSPGQTPVHTTPDAPTGLSTTAYVEAVEISWNASTTVNPSTPIAYYTVTAQSRTVNPTTGATGSWSSASTVCTTAVREARSCIATGLNAARQYRFRVVATPLTVYTPHATPSSPASSWSSVVRPDMGGSPPSEDPANVPPAPPESLPEVPLPEPDPIIHLDLSHTTAAARIRIPGYVAVPQGIVAIDNEPAGEAHQVQVVGGILAARFEVNDGRVNHADCTTPPNPPDPLWEPHVNCVSLGFQSENVQMRLRLVSTTPSGHERSVAIVQVNENGAFAVNSWEVQ